MEGGEVVGAVMEILSCLPYYVQRASLQLELCNGVCHLHGVIGFGLIVRFNAM